MLYRRANSPGPVNPFFSTACTWLLVGAEFLGTFWLVLAGCGTAVLAMAAARLWPVTVLASDIDAVAVDTAAANVIANGLDGRVICLEAAGFDHPMLEDNAPYDLVLANILKQPLIDLAPEMAQVVAPGGRVVLSGILTTQAQEVTQVYGDAGFTLERRDDLAEWSALVMERRV